MKWNWKYRIPHTVLKRQTLCFSSYKNHKLKVKLWWVGAHERRTRAFFVLFILSKENLFNICVLSECIVYWIHFQNIYIFTYQKTLLHTLLLLVLKIVESLQCILKCKLTEKLSRPCHIKIQYLHWQTDEQQNTLCKTKS